MKLNKFKSDLGQNMLYVNLSKELWTFKSFQLLTFRHRPELLLALLPFNFFTEV